MYEEETHTEKRKWNSEIKSSDELAQMINR